MPYLDSIGLARLATNLKNRLVPMDRKINGKLLNADITLSAADITQTAVAIPGIENPSVEDALTLQNETLAQIETSLTNKSNKNLLINGGLQVWQRGASFVAPVNTYTADRMKCNGTGTVSRATNYGGMKITGTINVRYIMEDIDYNQISGKRITLSYAKDGEIIVQTYTAMSSTVMNVNLSDCTIDWFKLELGEIATPFIPRPYTEELSLCQRFYRRLGYGIQGVILNNTMVSVAAIIDIPMRTNPTVTVVKNMAIHTFGISGDFTTANCVASNVGVYATGIAFMYLGGFSFSLPVGTKIAISSANVILLDAEL